MVYAVFISELKRKINCRGKEREREKYDTKNKLFLRNDAHKKQTSKPLNPLEINNNQIGATLSAPWGGVRDKY